MEHGKMHTGGHAHEDGHGHHHEEMPEGMSEAEKRKVLLSYLLQHNEHHEEEIRETAAALARDGHAEAAEFVRKAAESFAEGNENLRKALTFF